MLMPDSFTKKENIKKRDKKKKDKNKKKEERKLDNNKGKGFESMIIYVDKFGNFTSTPPELQEPTPIVQRNVRR